MSSKKGPKFSKELESINQEISDFQRLDDNILQADLKPVLDKMAGLNYNNSVSDANKYAETLTDLSHIGLEKSKKLQRGYLKPGYFSVWNHIKQSYSTSDNNTIDWKQFGQDISVFFNSIATVNFMSGLLYTPPESEVTEVKEKKKSEKRPREVIKEVVAPQQMTEEETNEFTKITQSLHKRIKKDLTKKQKEAIPFLPEMIDTTSFSKTVENCFGSSFLIANGRLGVSMEEDGEMHVSLTRPSEESEGQTKLNQGILSLNPKQTFELLKKSGLANILAPGWNTK